MQTYAIQDIKENQQQSAQPTVQSEAPTHEPPVSKADLEAAAYLKNLEQNDKVTESRISEKQALLKEAAQEVAPQGMSGQDASQLQNQRGGNGQEL